MNSLQLEQCIVEYGKEIYAFCRHLTMDVQEAAVRKAEGYENFRMDCLICEAKVCGTYTYVPVFSGFVTLTDKGEDRFCIQATSDYSYFHSQSE